MRQQLGNSPQTILLLPGLSTREMVGATGWQGRWCLFTPCALLPCCSGHHHASVVLGERRETKEVVPAAFMVPMNPNEAKRAL